MGSTCSSELDKTLSTRLKHLRKKCVICKIASQAMYRNRHNVCTTIMPNFKTPKG